MDIKWSCGHYRVNVLFGFRDERLVWSRIERRSLGPDLPPPSVPVKLSGTEWDLYKDIGAYCPNADLGDAAAQKHIADIYYFGAYNIDRDLLRAYVWYTLSANGGNENAVKTLSLVISELTPEQLKESQNLLKEWAPGQCEDDLNVRVDR